jgi:nicotinamidase-related amidase
MRFDPERIQLVIIDMQERLLAAMPADARATAERAAANLLWLAGELAMPVLVTEQYPQGLGPTVPALQPVEALAKQAFSAMDDPAIAGRLVREQVILCGAETHVCVNLTASDLRHRGAEVWVCADACLSRRLDDWRAGLEDMRAMGARVIAAETALFGLVGRAGTPLFKELSRRVR